MEWRSLRYVHASGSAKFLKVCEMARTIILLLAWSACGFCQDSVEAEIQKYRNQLARDPQNALAHLRLGDLLAGQQNLQAAANEFRSATKGDPHAKEIDAWAQVNLGKIFDITGQRARAINEYQKVVQNADYHASAARAVAARFISEDVSGTENAGFPRLHFLGADLRYVEPLKPLVKVGADYAEEARTAELEGSATFMATLAADGTVNELHLVRSLGLGLDETAADAAQKVSFELVKSDDSEVVSTAINFDFFLSQKQSHWHLVRVSFDTPEGTSAPHFVKTNYPERRRHQCGGV